MIRFAAVGVDWRPDIARHRVAWVASVAKGAEVLDGKPGGSNGPTLLAPMESNVIPLPHQLYALSRAISADRVRYLLADAVGLGKTSDCDGTQAGSETSSQARNRPLTWRKLPLVLADPSWIVAPVVRMVSLDRSWSPERLSGRFRCANRGLPVSNG